MNIRFMVKLPWWTLVAVSVICLMTQSVLWAVDACDHDRPKVCGGVTPGEGRIHDCMMQKINQLTLPCQKSVLKADTLNRSMEHLCRDDIQRFCAQYETLGRTRVIQCLQQRHRELAPVCRQAFDDYKALDYRVRE